MHKVFAPKASKHGKLRQDVLLGLLMSLWSSTLAVWIWSVVASISIILLFGPRYSIAYASILAPLVWLLLKWKSLLFEVLLLKSRMECELGLTTLWSLVDDSLYLGSLPLEPDAPMLMTKKLGVTAILSVMDGIEVDLHTFIGKPVHPMDWSQVYSVQQQIIYMGEFNRTMDVLTLHKAADYLNRVLSGGQKVYVHCRTGKWAGAVCVLAYFIKYKQNTAGTAYSFLNKRRRVGFGETSPEMNSLMAFQKSFRS